MKGLNHSRSLSKYSWDNQKVKEKKYDKLIDDLYIKKKPKKKARR